MTIVGNTAGTEGGGAYLFGGVAALLSNDTIAGNSGGAGGGIYITGATTTLLNTIVAGNSSSTGPDLDGTVALANNALIGNTSGLTITSGTGNLLNVSAGLATALASNGGPTQTLALLPGSPAISTGGAITSVSSAVTSPSATTISVQNAAAIAATPGSYYILIDQEEILVTGVNLVTNTLTVTRGVNGTTATTHAASAGVFLATDQRGVTRPTPPDIGATRHRRPWLRTQPICRPTQLG